METFSLTNDFSLEVNHIDGTPGNNSLSNLEWVTKSQNIQHAYDTGLRKILKGTDSAYAALTEKDVEFIRKSDLTLRELAEIFGVHHSTISRAKSGKRHT